MNDALVEVFIKGGVVLIPIFFLALFAWYLLADRYISTKDNPVPNRKKMLSIIETFKLSNSNKLKEKLLPYKGLYSNVVLTAYEYRNSGEEKLTHEVDELISRKWFYISARYDTIGVLASVIPLMGLLGTVMGMIHTFDMIMKFGSGNPVFMAGGISEALLTTQAGLVLTFPLIIAINSVQNRKNKIASQIEYTVSVILNSINKDNLNEKKV